MSAANLLRPIAVLAAVVPLAAALPPDGQPDSVRWSSSVGAVEFPHALHAEDLEIECASCHHGTSAMALGVPHPEYFDDFWVDCAVCHTGREASDAAHRCATCHPPRPTRGAVEMPTVKVAIHRSCWSCHERGSGAEASARCGTCHQRDRRAEVPPSGAPRGQ